MHGGFLYQHLFAVGCLLLAQKEGTRAVRVEGDEDIELLRDEQTVYVQVKTRDKRLARADVLEFLKRTTKLRKVHAESRGGDARFYLVANVAPARSLATEIATRWMNDTHFRRDRETPFLPPAFESVDALFAWCVDRAAEVPLRSVAATTLVWKLAAIVLAACAGGGPGRTFLTDELPELFEQGEDLTVTRVRWGIKAIGRAFVAAC